MKGTKAQFVVETREEAVAKYLPWFQKERMNDPKVKQALDEMIEHVLDDNDLNLVCYCAPLLCHCQHIKEYIEQRILDIKSLK